MIPPAMVRIDPMPDGPRPSTITGGVSVVIPVKNGGAPFAELLRKIRSQKKVGEVEIVVLDSESTDDSVAVAGSFGCRVIPILQKEFNHGATRDLGARAAGGEYLVFTVQDAVPVSDYWFYAMACPFRSVPDLGVVTARQFTRPEADLFSLWSNDRVNAMIGFAEDSVYGLDPSGDPSGWKRLDSLSRRRVAFVDDVCSCIPRAVYEEVPFRPLANAEDIDLGIRMIEAGKRLGYLASTGVYHWHARGADYFLKRSYIGTKANVHLLGNALPGFFGRHGVDREAFVRDVAGLIDLMESAAPPPGAVDPDPVKAVGAFVSSFRRRFDAGPEIAAPGEDRASARERLERLCPGLSGNTDIPPVDRDRFGRNFLVPHVLREIEDLAGFLARTRLSLGGRGEEFRACLRKILASVVGEAAGAFYLESETGGRLTEELERMDRLLAKGVCSF